MVARECVETILKEHRGFDVIQIIDHGAHAAVRFTAIVQSDTGTLTYQIHVDDNENRISLRRK